jgi:hypothetical protein
MRRRRRYGTGRRLRLFYFGLTAAWGFTIGVASVVVALLLEGRAIRLSPVLGGAALVGAIVALTGSALSATAYRQARRRDRV